MPGYKVLGTFQDPDWAAQQQRQLSLLLQNLAGMADQRRQEKEQREHYEMQQALGLIQDERIPPEAKLAISQDLAKRYGNKYPWVGALAESFRKPVEIAQAWQGAGNAFQGRMDALSGQRQSTLDTIAAAPDQVPTLMQMPLGVDPNTGQAIYGPAPVMVPNAAKQMSADIIQQQPDPFSRAWQEMDPIKQSMVHAYFKSAGMADQLPLPNQNAMDPEIAQIGLLQGRNSQEYLDALRTQQGLMLSPADKQAIEMREAAAAKAAKEAHDYRTEEEVAREAARAQQQADRLAAQKQMQAERLAARQAKAGGGGKTGPKPESISSIRTLITQRTREIAQDAKDAADAGTGDPVPRVDARKQATVEVYSQRSPDLQQVLGSLNHLPPDAQKKLRDQIYSDLAGGKSPETVAAAIRAILGPAAPVAPLGGGGSP